MKQKINKIKNNKKKNQFNKKLIIIPFFIFFILLTLCFYNSKSSFVTIKFNTDGGNTIEPIKIKKNSTIKELPIPEKSGYSFECWELNGELFKENTIIDNDIILKAKWKKKDENNEQNKEVDSKEDDDKENLDNSNEENTKTETSNKENSNQTSTSKPGNQNTNNINNNSNDTSDKNDHKSIEAKKVYFCDAGYTLNEIYCEKTLITEPTKKYTCPDDFTVQGQYCKKSKKVSMVEETLNYIKNYGNNSQFENKTDLEIKQIACNYLGGKFSEEDFNQNRDTWCFKYSGTITTGAALVLECNDQYVLNNDQCLFFERINAKYEYYCESGYTLHEDKCLKN